MNVLHAAAACVLVAAVAGGAGYWRGHNAGEAKVQAAWDRERAQLAEEHAKAMAAAREKEQALQAGADQLKEETNAKLKEVNARAAALADSLRKRPERTAESSAVSGATSACAGATGATLARPDAEFLAGYAADAARLQAALDQCVRQYQSLRPQ